jgi:hypothetical protein
LKNGFVPRTQRHKRVYASSTRYGAALRGVRIVVIGNAAGGKSTLARHLARRRDLRLVEANRLFWQHEWQLRSEPTMRAGTLRSLRGDTADQRRRDRCVFQKGSKTLRAPRFTAAGGFTLKCPP